jgi:hypothetical protein
MTGATAEELENMGRELDAAAFEELQRIAKALGYDRAWFYSDDPPKWFLERRTGPGTVDAYPLDSAIADLIRRAGEHGDG